MHKGDVASGQESEGCGLLWSASKKNPEHESLGVFDQQIDGGRY